MERFTVTCRCGEQFHVDEGAVGRHIACRRCGRTVEVKQPRGATRSSRSSRSSSTKADSSQDSQATKPTAGRQPIVMPVRGVRRLLIWLTWAYLGGVALVALLMWGWGDRSIVGTILLFMGRWVVLLPLALLVPAAAWLRRDLLLPLTAAALLALGPIMGFRTGWRRMLPAPSAAGPTVRVLGFNAGGGAVLAQLLPEFLRRWEPQIVAFQECGEPLAAAIQRLPDWQRYVGRDLCVLSRYPIRDLAVMDRSELDRVKQSEVKELGGAGYVVRMLVDGPRGPFRVADLHLETPRKGLEGLMDRDLRRLRMNTEIRDVESHLARQWVDSGSGPLVVLGDFNTPVESRIYRKYWGSLSNAFSTHGTGFGMTKYNGWIRARIDHVLTSDEWLVRRVQVGHETYSDHRPLVVDLALRN